MIVDSHCHLDFPDLRDNLPDILSKMNANGVHSAVCIGVNLEDFPAVLSIADSHPALYATVGVHPEYTDVDEPTVDTLINLANHPKVIGIGETGLDYYWHKDKPEWQRDRFRTHIRAAKACQKPLIIHTRDSVEDTLAILEAEAAGEAGGVMHCFTENLDMARRAIDLGFYISISGIVTFKNAAIVKEVAKNIPLDRLLIETDSPYLAPVPFRGKRNQPAYVRHVAEEIAALRECAFEEIATATTQNFYRLFKGAAPC